ncbi:MAG: hypothetical protein JNK35_11295 [Phycisphaerae bacterium]|nr:hypothetical protein [Phycisphaerae bacterium]
MDDPFDTLGLPARFDLDRGAIEAAYLSRAAAAHPDRGGTEGVDFEATIARLNAARGTLLDAEKRARALLARLTAGEAKITPGGAEDRALPPGFLEAMMEARERMEAERGQPGSAERWEAWAEARRAGHVKEVGRLLAEAGARPVGGRAVALAAVRRELNAWRYVERMLEQIIEA